MDIQALLQMLQQRFGQGSQQTAFAGGSPGFRENRGIAQLNPTATPVNPMATGGDTTGGIGPKPMMLGGGMGNIGGDATGGMGGGGAPTAFGGGNPQTAIMRILQGMRPGGQNTMRMQQF